MFSLFTPQPAIMSIRPAAWRKGPVDSGMRYRRQGVSMGLPSLSEYELWRTDEEEFRACAERVHALPNS